MKKVPAVLAVLALIGLPILAAPKPTPTPAANRKKVLDGKTSRMPVPPTVTPVPAAGRKSQTIYQEGRGGAPAAVTPTAGPVSTTTTINASKSVSLKEGQSTPPTCARLVNGKIEHYPCPLTPGGTTERDKLKGSTKTQGDFNLANREGQPTTPTPTAGPVGWDNHDGVSKRRPSDGREKQKGTSNVGREKHPKIKSTTSNGSLKEGEGAPGTPLPTAGPVGAIQLNSSRSNIYREVAPTTTPEPTEKGRGLGIAAHREEGQPTPTRTAGPVPNDGREKQKGTSNVGRETHPKYVAGRVLSQQGRRLTVKLSDGTTVAVDSSGLNPTPRVGSTVNVTNSGGRWFIVLR